MSVDVLTHSAWRYRWIILGLLTDLTHSFAPAWGLLSAITTGPLHIRWKFGGYYRDPV
ncbi:hypothetical protein FHR32_007697 [Streptosporangium album]|uniref:Uncharacterized protein n=1 Tax=Streptosporangium album TaxID=47479 RepID=A0A7W7S4E1_9ACTN|nr:hypothetical protein [Streptosporangium album]